MIRGHKNKADSKSGNNFAVFSLDLELVVIIKCFIASSEHESHLSTLSSSS